MKITLELTGRPDFCPAALRLAAAHLGALANPGEYAIVTDIAAQIETQIPKRHLTEPGLWAIVKAGDVAVERRCYVREGVKDIYRWNPIGSIENVRWSDLIDPVLIREGI